MHRAEHRVHRSDLWGRVCEGDALGCEVHTVHGHLELDGTCLVRRRDALEHVARHASRCRGARMSKAAQKGAKCGRALQKRSAVHPHEGAASRGSLGRTDHPNGWRSEKLEQHAVGAEVLVVHADLEGHVTGTANGARDA